MIGAFVCGGLGNQMFQYAAARALALRRGTGLKLDLAAFGKPGAFEVDRPYELDKLAIAVEPARRTDALSFLLARREQAALRRFSGWATVREQAVGFDPAVKQCGDGTYLFGYWQSWRYFDDCAAQLRAELQPRVPLSDQSGRLRDAMQSANSLALHVRRGDYVTSAETASFHGALSTDFYAAAVQFIRERAPGLHCYVFSDDLDWCREALQHLGLPLTFVDVNRGADSWQDLYLMAACRHSIIANSSFSWWAAWLGDGQQHAERMVVAPQRWFAGADTVVADRCPPGWTVL
ncbi:alpha-1,2-fucosyltransferase [Novosphingobium sp.]|uniref:alpha-1,2-fucosyltransferase n=1 Tax=Novosphingobium sp. TaxID=1874826 RepID=UPI0035ADCA15